MIHQRLSLTFIAIFAALMMTDGAFAVQPGQAAQGEIGNEGSRHASCILRIPGSDSMLPLDQGFLTSIMTTSAVRGAAVRSVVKAGASAMLDDEYVRTHLVMIGGPDDPGSSLAPTYFELDVVVAIEDMDGHPFPAVAEEIQAALVARLRQALEQMSERNAATLHDSIAETEARLENARQRLDRLRAERKAVSEAAGRIDLNRDRVREEIVDVESQLRELEVEHVAQQARQTAIEVRIAQAAESQTRQLEKDSILNELRQLVEIQQARFDRLEKLLQQKSVSETEILAAREALIESRVRMQERRELIAAEHGPDVAAAFNMQLADMSVGNAELAARQELLRSRLKELARQLELVESLGLNVELGLPDAREAVRIQMERLAELRARLATFRPLTLDVVGDIDGKSTGKAVTR